MLDSAAVSYGQATPYFPILDLLRRYCHLEEGEDAGIIQAKVTEQVLTLDTALQDTVPALLALLDTLPADSPFLRLNALKRVLLRQSQEQPLLLVCEDLHWLDTETQALLDSLVESLPTARLLLLVNYRPDYRHDWGSKTYYTQVRLALLPSASADALLRTLVGDDPSLAPFTALLIQRTEGNPFFLEESVRTLVETGVLQGERGAYHLGQAPQTIQVPATVQAVLAARIDRLPLEEKRLLQTAAVIGTEVPLPLLQERRRMLHARIVAALEGRAGDHGAEQVERLAYHALRGEVWEKALAYCWQAGEKAMARSAHHEAAGYFEQALDALQHLPETHDTHAQAIDLRLALRSALYPLGDLERILVYLREAESLAEAVDDSLRLGQVSLYLSFHFYLRGVYDEAIAAAQRVLALATTCGNVVLHALANYYLGTAYIAQGNYLRAIDCLGQTMASLEGAQRRERFGQVFPPAVSSRAYLAWCHAELGMFAAGTAHSEEGLRIAEAVDQPGSLMRASWGIGLLAFRQGDLPKALPLLERALRICQEANLLTYFPRTAAALGAAYTLGGRVADAVPLLTQAVEHAMAMEMVVDQAHCHLSLGEAQMMAGSLEEAQALAERTLALARAHRERDPQAYALHLFGDIAARRDPPEVEQAEAHYREALALADELGMRPLQAHCHRGLGTLYGQLGRALQARAALGTAIELYRAMEMTFWLPQAEAALAQTGARA